MESNDFEENDIEETGSSSGYSFPGFGTGNYYKENDVNINNEDNIVNISGRGDVSPSTNQSNISGNSSRDFGTQDSSNNLSSGNNIDNPTSNNGGNIKTNNGSKSNDSIDNKTNSNINSNSNVSNKTNPSTNNKTSVNNKGLKSGINNSNVDQSSKSNINSGRVGGFKNSLKNFGLGIFNSARSGAKNMEASMQGEDAPEQNEVGDTLNGFGRGIGKVTNIILLVGGFKILVFVISLLLIIILLITFLPTIISIAQSAIFGGIKASGWQCNMYSPVPNSNPGEVSSFYTWRIWNGIPDAHTGIDISYEAKGEKIIATHDGVVVETNYERDGATGEPYGVYIKIEDPKETEDEKKYRTYYAHMCSLEEERELKASCEAGNYKGCDDNCKKVIKQDGTVGYEYTWSCGKSEQEFESLINKLQVGATVQKNDVLGYISDTGSRSAACDFHVHYEIQADDLADNPDEGFVPESPNRYFNIETSSTGCDPVLNNRHDPPTIDEIIDWECEIHELVVEPDDDEELNDEIFNYCDVEEPITPEEYRYNGEIDIKLSQSAINGEYTYEEGLGTYVGKVCGYDAKPAVKKTTQCAGGVYQYYNSFLSEKNSEAWNRFLAIRDEGSIGETVYGKYSARTYWKGNASLNAKNDGGFATGNEPKAGAIYCNKNSPTGDSLGDYGHVMTVTKVEGNVVHVYECNGSGSTVMDTKCGNRTYTRDELEGDGFLGYIYVISDEECEE